MSEKDQRIFEFFSQLTLADYFREIEFTTSRNCFVELFYQVITNNHTILLTNTTYTVAFLKRRVNIRSYLFQISNVRKCTSFQIEAFTDKNMWEMIDIQEIEVFDDTNDNSDDNESQPLEKTFQIQLKKEIICNSLRLTFNSSPDVNDNQDEDEERFDCHFDEVNFKVLEFFGEIIDMESIISKFPRDVQLPSWIDFQYRQDSNNGIFNFFEKCSLKNRCEIFSVTSESSKNHNPCQIVTLWNQGCWNSQDLGYCRWIEIRFFEPWEFKPTGYRIKSGDWKFIKSWKFEVAEDDYEVIDEIISDELCFAKKEKSFSLKFDQFSTRYLFEVFENSEGEPVFCLCGFKLFGILRKKGESEPPKKSVCCQYL